MSSESESPVPDERPHSQPADSRPADRDRRDRSDTSRDRAGRTDRGAGQRKPYNRDARDGGQRTPYDRDNRASGASRGGSAQRGRPGERDQGPRSTREQGRPRGDRGEGGRADARPPRPRRDDRPPEPVLPEDVSWDQLDREARARLRTLSKTNAELVGAHLVMAGRLLDEDPQLAYEHAQAAVRRAGRVDVVREAAALTAYATGRYAEALRELRTVRRLSAIDAHRAIEADCERGLGRPDRALVIVAEAPAGLPLDEQVELAIVASGARLDLGEPEAALSVLERADDASLSAEAKDRLEEAKRDVLVALGRIEPEAADAPASGSAAGGSDDQVADEPDDDDIIDIDDVLDER